jgi:uncharacterized small protein (DUF1192 family)
MDRITNLRENYQLRDMEQLRKDLKEEASSERKALALRAVAECRYYVGMLRKEASRYTEMYRNLPVNHPSLPALLAGLQASEKVISDLLWEIEHVEDIEKDSLYRIEKIKAEIERRDKLSKKEKGKFYIPEEDQDAVK